MPGYKTSWRPADFLACQLPHDRADLVLVVVAGKIMADDCSVCRAALIKAPDRTWLVRSKVEPVPDAPPEPIMRAAVVRRSAR